MQPLGARRPVGSSAPGRVFGYFACAIVPLLGMLAELATSSLGHALVLFPRPWYVVPVAVAMLLNLAVQGGWLRAAPSLHAMAFGFVGGMAGLYGLVMAPALPIMVLLAILLLGVLAAAPYLTLIGLALHWPRLSQAWRADGRSGGALAVFVLGPAALPFLVVGSLAYVEVTTETKVADLHRAMQRGDAVATQALAGELRSRPLAPQRDLCDWPTWEGREEQTLDVLRGPGQRHGRFWFFPDERPLEPAAARLAYFRAHGEACTPASEAAIWRSRPLVQWTRSRFEVAVEPEAALARIDWLLQVESSSQFPREATFWLQLPAGAVASSLSLWIDDEERPAAFAAAARAEAAYEDVVRKERDPALLQEVRPGLVELRLFPVSDLLPPMRARVGLTVAMPVRSAGAVLTLPRVIRHDCWSNEPDPEVELLGLDGLEPAGAASADAVAGAVADALERWRRGDLDQPLRLPGFSPRVAARDHDGIVVQDLATARLEPAARRVIVIEGSSAILAAVADPGALLFAWPEEAPCTVFVVQGNTFVERDGNAGDAQLLEWLREQVVGGGGDSSAALVAATERAAAAGLDHVTWLHGPAAMLLSPGEFDLAAGVTVAALAVAAGDNRVRDMLAERDVGYPIGPLVRGSRDWRGELAAWLAGDDLPWRRELTRSPVVPVGAPEVSDHLARLWAAAEARKRERDEAGSGSPLAARYRLVTAGAAAVVLESAEQYARNELEPGALVGREPRGPAGSPVPEPGTLLLVGTGLAAMAVLRRRQKRRIG